MNALPKTVKNGNVIKLSSVSEVRKVSVDDGYTQIPNELLFAMGQFGFTQRQFNLLIAVIQKTLSWHKEMDWISNSQLCELVDLPDEQKASKTKQELIRMNVLVQQGNKIGINLAVSKWEKRDCTKDANIARNVQKKLHKSCKSDCTKDANTKETITKEKINIESTNVDSVQQPENSVVKKSKSEPVDYQGVMEEFNQAVENTPIPKIRAMSDERKRATHTLAKILRKEFGGYSREHFADYFRDFVQQAMSRKDRFYFGGVDGSGWVANFGYIIRSKTFYKTWEDSL